MKAIAAGRSGLVFDIKKFSIHDGPGIRTTVFLKGCPLSCAWCHNPESQAARAEVYYRRERCILCGECLETCPQGAISRSPAAMETDLEVCTRCGTCGATCPAEAREIVGQKMGVEAVMAEIEKDRLFYDQSRGGATFSGGEPLMQPSFLLGLLEACGSRGVHRAVDTCGFVRSNLLQTVADSCDLFLFDLKHMDSESHRRLTGVPNELIHENLRMLVEIGKEVWLRFPVIGGCNDDDWNVRETARFARSLEGVERVHLLEFHTATREKHRRFRVPYRMEGLGPVSEKRMIEIREIFGEMGLATNVGG